jgi:5'-deoxynucleotidase YfbR-like HD superfamily hydrolase
MNIYTIIRLSELLGEMGNVRRGTKLPNGEFESDSHHSFSLALIAYHIVTAHCPELDVNKVVLYALVHDLLEIVTGDEDTLHYTPKQFAQKHEREKAALAQFKDMFATYPELKDAMLEYEKLDTPEAATVFVLDKACTTWTHFWDKGAYAKERNIANSTKVIEWADRQRSKFTMRLVAMPPQKIFDIYEQSFEALKGLYED